MAKSKKRDHGSNEDERRHDDDSRAAAPQQQQHHHPEYQHFYESRKKSKVDEQLQLVRAHNADVTQTRAPSKRVLTDAMAKELQSELLEYQTVLKKVSKKVFVFFVFEREHLDETSVG